jgi:hypothetical protein
MVTHKGYYRNGKYWTSKSAFQKDLVEKRKVAAEEAAKKAQELKDAVAGTEVK